jgi:hypothetical protein
MVVALTLLSAVAIFFVTRHPSGKAGRTPSPAPAGSRTAAARPGGTGAVRTALTGPGLISTALIFPHSLVVVDGIQFSRVIAVLNNPCAPAARGAFAAGLISAGCQRVVRATFADSSRRYAVTVGVAAFPSPAAASLANRRGKFGRDVWLTGLNGPAGSGATAVSASVGLGYDVVYGRYIVYALATFSNGRNPTGHAGKVRMLTALSQSFAALAGRPLLASPP